MKKTLLFFMILWLVTSCGADLNLRRGEKYLALGEYYDAANEFRQAYQKTPAKERAKRGQIARKMAMCYDKSLQTARALAAWRNAIRYQQADTADRLAFAQTLMKNGNYREAEEQFQLVLDSLPHDKLARDGLFAARKAPDIKQLGSRYTVKRMEVFNSRRADYCPMLFGDEYDQLYFTSTRNEAQGDELSGITGTKPGDIFFSQKDDKGKWSKPEDVSGGVNTAYDEGACCFSADGREMFLTQCVTDPSYPRYAQIVKSSRSDAAWGKATEVKLTGDTLSSYAHPAISPDGEWLYFTSDMPGGKGGLDIWRVRITPAGYGGVENLGEPVNTPGDEAFPTFRPNGDLYFSSNGHPGLGGLDIFIAKVGKDGRYHLSHPGYPLNSQGDDFGMTFEGPYNRGFFSSNRGDARGWDHIYSFVNPEIMQTVKGWVYEMDGYELPAAQVYVIGDDGTNEKMSVHSDGSFTKVLDPGVSYLFLATCKGYLNHQEQVKALVNPKESRDTTLQFALANISAPTLIDNIFYDFDKATLRDSSKTALDKLVALLNENPHVTIELSAHCDYKGSAEYNKRLSQRRAEAVVAYLIAHGIAADRLTPVGYGKERPKKIKKKLTEKYQWLKEGDVLTEDFIKALKDKKKEEICNQLNRRTEFSVLRTTYGLFDKNGKLKETPKPKKTEDKQDDGGVYFDLQ
ncbi:OmpA family protein [Hallella mizrahii]|uniref:OmpA family protein n=1 Tax=Hallella mizrahii TaxID=2606637 RepID=A0A7K0KB05_9BACT|nr:OmpA family protein [Hallella mizrahii]MST83112.1 OmpA family protein [Hallella mizrahii]